MSAVDQVLAAFTRADWTVAAQEKVGSGPNPTRVLLARGKQRLALLAYAWKVTGEGKGRTGTNFRIQTTRSHDGPLMTEPARLTIGFGIESARAVLVVFDGWTKRNTGASSSVHIKRALLDTAQASGAATDGEPWDSRAACRIANVEALTPWIMRQVKERFAAVQPLNHAVSGETATATCDLWDRAPAAWLRVGDQLVLADRVGEHLLDNSIWQVTDLSVKVTSEGRYPRRAVTFALERLGRVKNEAHVLEGLTRRPVA